ncbi:hypothetical protein E2562_006026 [Oryza meyeriana var. granulata]|uniref:Rhodanese domain-containing protein n=1 Tax=Oryza meyeriana var. granulata TaxID=110450 RepID=A0A6G1EVD8_9ORYZ|nr:hypothetical protein E2562_006026 [Oryza meyeriana var. granulata]
MCRFLSAPFSRRRGEGREEVAMARSVSYVSAAKLLAMARGNPRVAIIDVRDEERSYQAHIAGSHHFSSLSFAARLPELARATTDKDTLVFHCALSKVQPPVHLFSAPANLLAALRLITGIYRECLVVRMRSLNCVGF